MTIFILTQGPVYKLWRTAETYTPIPITPTWQATFLLVQIPALMLLSYRWKMRHPIEIGHVFLLLFLAWMMISTLWTNLSRYVVVDSLCLLVSALTGLYFGFRFQIKQLIFVIWGGTQSGVILAYFAIKSHWTESLDSNGNWIGIYFNRNSLGPVALVALVTSLQLLFVASRRSRQYRVVVVSVLSLLVALDITVLIRTGSVTPWLALGGSVLAALVWVGLIATHSKLGTDGRYGIHLSYWAFLSASTLAVWLIFRYQDFLGQLVGSPDIFSGRSAFWNFSWTGFLERPWIGWGWRAAWFTPEFLKREMYWSTVGSNWSHNAYLEVLLGGGVIGLTLFIAYVALSGYSLVTRSSHSGEYWRIGTAFFILVASTQEVFIIGNHFLWVLLVAAFTRPISNQDDTTSNRSQRGEPN